MIRKTWNTAGVSALLMLGFTAAAHALPLEPRSTLFSTARFVGDGSTDGEVLTSADGGVTASASDIFVIDGPTSIPSIFAHDTSLGLNRRDNIHTLAPGENGTRFFAAPTVFFKWTDESEKRLLFSLAAGAQTHGTAAVVRNSPIQGGDNLMLIRPSDNGRGRLFPRRRIGSQGVLSWGRFE